MSGLASLGLLFPGGMLEPMWRLNPEARADLGSLGPAGIGLMATVSIACLCAAYGLRSLSAWGHKLALALLGVNLLGDVANAVFRHDLRTLIGIPIAGALIAYLLQSHMRELFRWRSRIRRRMETES